MQRDVYTYFLMSFAFWCPSLYAQPEKPVVLHNTIQAGSFTQKSNAERYQLVLQGKTQYPVRIVRASVHHQVFYKVIIGPVPSKLALRNTAAKVFGSQTSSWSSMNHFVSSRTQKPLPSRMPPSPTHASVPSFNNQWSELVKDNEYTLFLGGTYIPNTLHGQTLQLRSYELGSYADTFTKQSDSGTFTWGLSLGHRFYLDSANKVSDVFDSFAINSQFFQITSSNQTGHVLQFGLPEFENYAYQLGISNYRFMADCDLDFHPIKNFIGFIEGGVGGANTTFSYGSTPISPVDAPGLYINKETNWSFAYQLGTGLKYRPLSHWELSVRYLYANMGTVSSSMYGSTDLLAVPLKADMSTHNFLFGFSYRGDYIEK